MINNREATRCMFHDEKYLEGDNYEKNKQVVVNRFNRKLSKYRSDNMHLLLMGYHLPEISFDYYQFADFSETKFCGKAYFTGATFFNEANFSCEFNGEAYFNYVLFEDERKKIQ